MNLAIVAVTYNHGRKLRVFLDSVALQTSPDWRLYLLHDGPANNETRDIVNEFSREFPDKFKFESTENRENIYGHNLRGIGLSRVDSEEYINFQNADNYLIPKFVEFYLNSAKTVPADFIVSNMIHDYAGTCMGLGEYAFIDVKPQVNFIDMGSFIVRAEIAKKVGFPFRSFAADWEFISHCLPLCSTVSKLSACTFVHN